jgi:GT2 family glycosyltransferase
VENSTLSPQAKDIQSNNTGLPLVSVVIPTYNRKQYIQEAINSALAQTYPAVEIIVVDDGSTDDTDQVLKARYGERIRYVFQDNQGESVARNKAICLSRGQYVALLDSDDVWLPTKLERQVALMERQPELGLVSCHALKIDAQGNLTRSTPVHTGQTTNIVSLETLLLNSPLYCSTVLIRKHCLDQVGLFAEGIRYGEDRDLFLRVAARSQVGFVDEPLVSLRSHTGAQSRPLVPKQEVERRMAERIQIVERVFPLFQGDAATLAALKARTLAREYVRGAISISMYGEYERGASLLYQAVDLDPATWQDGKQVAELSLRHAVVLSKEQTLAAAVRFVEGVYAHLPAHLYSWNPRFRRQVLGELQVEFAFWQYQRGKASSVPRHALRGVLYDPAWLRNRGLWSIAMRALTNRLAVQTGSENLQTMRTRKSKNRVFE